MPLGQQCLGSAVERCVMDNGVTRRGQRQEGGADCRHARSGKQGAFRTVEQHQPVLNDFRIGVVETAIDQTAGTAVLRRRLAARRHVKKVGAFFRRLKGECRSQEHGGFDGPLGHRRVVSIGHHLRGRVQGSSTYLGAAKRLRFRHGELQSWHSWQAVMKTLSCPYEREHSSFLRNRSRGEIHRNRHPLAGNRGVVRNEPQHQGTRASVPIRRRQPAMLTRRPYITFADSTTCQVASRTQVASDAFVDPLTESG